MLVYVVPPSAWALEERASAISLPTLLAQALRDNPDLLAARKRWEAAQAKVPLAKALPAPKIGVEWENIPRGGLKFNQAELMYQLIQSLPFPGKLSLRHQVAVKEAQMAAMQFKQTEWDVLSQVKASYADLFLLDREREIQQEQVIWLQQATATAQSRYATGAATQAEALRLQTELLEASNALTVLDERRQAMAAHLNHLLNRPAHALLGATELAALTPLDFSVDELTAIATARQPELLLFQFSAERAEAAWRLSKRELLPDVETMFELRDPAMGPIGPWDLSLALVLPFWFWTKWHYGIRAALYDKESAQAAYQAMCNEITKRIHEHWHEARAAYLTAKLCQDGLINFSQQALSSSLAAYQGGRGSSMEVLDALRMLAERRRTYFQHLVAYEQHVVMLEESVGIPLRPTHELHD